MSDKCVKVAAVLDKVSTQSARTLKLTFSTQEVQADASSIIMGMHQCYGWLIFAPENEPQVQIPNEPPPEFGRKSLSERMRDVLWVKWSKLKDIRRTKLTFEDWRKNEMERMIDEIKGDISELS